MIDKVKQGKRNRRAGADFERKVMKDIEAKGYICARWTKNVEFYEENSEEVLGILKGTEAIYGKLINAKSNRFNMRTTGFPDFVLLRHSTIMSRPEAIECKMNGRLSKQEKDKCSWLLKAKIFSRIFVASQDEDKKIKYVEFKE